MGIFEKLAALIADGAGRLGAAIAVIRDAVARIADRDVRRQAAFAIAVIALSAKMAKADGIVSRSEVDAFCRIFTIPPGEERNVARLYNLAKQDVAGFDIYAREMARLLADDRSVLSAVLDGLFDIARADGAVHERELRYLEQVAGHFGFTAEEFATISARHVVGEGCDPYCVLGADASWDFPRLKAQYRKLVVENHPDRLASKGVPEEFLRIANDRLASINAAWERIERQRLQVGA